MTKKIPLTQGKVAIVDDEDFEYLNQWKWNASKGWGGNYYAVRLSVICMHRVILNAPKGMVVDHVNGNGLDNRRENLRLCTTAENSRNRKRQSNNKTGFNGVYWDKNKNKYEVRIHANKKKICLGYFPTPEEAARVYDEAAKKYHGDFAHLNFPGQ